MSPSQLPPHGVRGDGLPSHDLNGLDDDSPEVVYGLVVRYQHPSTNAVFLTFANETGHTPVSPRMLYQRNAL